ncbi:MAG: aminotransferase class I/II-fold pyridoxal phosphate-dependent enzyme [Woeseiaceae bacterium]
MLKKNKTLSIETQLVHDPSYAEGAIAPPIYQTSLFTFDTYQSMVDRYLGEVHQAVYSRVDNPTNTILHDKIAALEGSEAALAFSSGMAAISNAILSIVRPGDRVVCIKNVYADTYRLLRGPCARLNIETVFVDGTDVDDVKKNLPGAKLLYLESPNTWMFEEQDLATLAALARAESVLTIADNSWASPINQNPLQLGVDLVVHSATKYISGHSDTVAGVVAGSERLIERIDQDVRPYLGAALSAQDAARLIRGLRTLPLRIQRHHDSGLQIAKKLVAHEHVKRVCHPGIQRENFSPLKGYGGLFSFELHDGIDIPAFCDALALFRLGVSWGGYESLVVPAAVSHSQVGANNAAVDFGVPPGMIRLFVGLEDPGELWTDLLQAFEVAANGQRK